MKELFMKEQQKLEHENNHAALIHSMAKKSIEEYILESETPCPNCNELALVRNESNAKCLECAQEFTYVNNALRFL